MIQIAEYDRRKSRVAGNGDPSVGHVLFTNSLAEIFLSENFHIPFDNNSAPEEDRVRQFILEKRRGESIFSIIDSNISGPTRLLRDFYLYLPVNSGSDILVQRFFYHLNEHFPTITISTTLSTTSSFGIRRKLHQIVLARTRDVERIPRSIPMLRHDSNDAPLDPFELGKTSWITDWGMSTISFSNFNAGRVDNTLRRFTNSVEGFRNSFTEQQVSGFYTDFSAVEDSLVQRLRDTYTGERQRDESFSEYLRRTGRIVSTPEDDEQDDDIILRF